MAKPFRLHAVLAYRQRRALEQEALVGRLLRAESEARRILHDLRVHLAEEQQRAVAPPAAPIDLPETQRAQLYRELVEGLITDQAAAAASLSAQRQRAQEELVMRKQEQRALDKLRERYEAAAAADEQRREAVHLDNLTMSRTARGRAG